MCNFMRFNSLLNSSVFKNHVPECGVFTKPIFRTIALRRGDTLPVTAGPSGRDVRAQSPRWSHRVGLPGKKKQQNRTLQSPEETAGGANPLEGSEDAVQLSGKKKKRSLSDTCCSIEALESRMLRGSRTKGHPGSGPIAVTCPEQAGQRDQS